MSEALLDVYPRLPIHLERAQGQCLYASDGRELLDLYGGHAVTPLGHGHPALTRALCEGHRELDFFSNSLHMAVQRRAAEGLLEGSAHLRHAHFVNSGTEANEAAIHLARRLSGRKKILSFDCSFHGRTQASLAATGLPGYRRRLSVPEDEAFNGFISFGAQDDLAAIDESVAAVLCESVPSLAGVLMPPEGYYPALEARCREAGALLIFDEVQGGCGRLGHFFAHERFSVQPDMVTLAKGVAGGYPAGALLVTAGIGAAVEHGELGTTFGGGPMACRMIETTARLIREEGLLQRVGQIFARIAAGVKPMEGVKLRGAGCLIGLTSRLPAKMLQKRLLEANILVGTSADPRVLRLLPAYTLTDEEIDRFLDALGSALAEA
ncbi:MAG: aspartate aminotransferase family protein [Deltaproteobacteria bacterium]|nr:aspartate aminotransferase family protein [Deltaproteobacteria bacterium]